VVTFANRSANNQKALQFDLNMYQELKKEYNAEVSSVRTLKDWIRKTVAPNYQQTCCKPAESIKEWYKNLKENVQFSNKEIKAELRSKYKLAIKLLTKPKDALNWIMRWEQTMALAQDKNLPVTKDHEDQGRSTFAEEVERLRKQKDTSGGTIRQRDDQEWLVRSVGECTAAFVTVRSETAFSIAQYPLKNSAILDSGMTIRIFNEIARFLHFRTAPQGDFVWAGDSKIMKVEPSTPYAQSQNGAAERSGCGQRQSAGNERRSKAAGCHLARD
jgi:hypothetical protein